MKGADGAGGVRGLHVRSWRGTQPLMECIPFRMAGQGRRQGTLSSIELLPEAFVIAAQMAKKSQGLALPVLPAFGTNDEEEAPSQDADMQRIMPHGVDELGPHLSRDQNMACHAFGDAEPAASHMLAASHSS